jgi:hypothetical protein
MAAGAFAVVWRSIKFDVPQVEDLSSTNEHRIVSNWNGTETGQSSELQSVEVTKRPETKRIRDPPRLWGIKMHHDASRGGTMHQDFEVPTYLPYSAVP